MCRLDDENPKKKATVDFLLYLSGESEYVFL